MTKLVWGDAGTRFFETGVDRGVLYLSDQDGVAWNGLTSVEEAPSGGEAKPYYQDGVKYLNLSSREEFEATIEAFSAPAEFGPCDGTALIQNGLFVSQQPRRAFSLCYRTMIGNDLNPEAGYKLHLVYNALAAPANRANGTITNSPEVVTMSWSLTTLPPSLTGYKPTAHFVIDSRLTPPNLLANLENILYGSDAADARIPPVSELVALFQSQGPQIRRNYSTDSKPVTTTNWSTNGTTPSVVAAPWDAAKTAYKSISPGGTGFYILTRNSTRTWGIGDVVTFSATIQAPAGAVISVSVHARTGNVYYRDTAAGSASAVVSTGAPIRLFHTTTLTAAHTDMDLAIFVYNDATGANLAVGAEVYVSETLYELADTMLWYFNGDTTDADGYYYSWVGTPNLSSSIVNSWK